MLESDAQTESANLETFQECLSGIIIQHLARPSAISLAKGQKKSRASRGRRTAIKPVDRVPNGANADVEELDEFTQVTLRFLHSSRSPRLTTPYQYLATEIFTTLPLALRTLTFAATQADSSLVDQYPDPLPSDTLDTVLIPLPITVSETLTSYNLIASPTDLTSFLARPLNAYITAVTAVPAAAFEHTARARASACELCVRDWVPLTYHHLVPRAVHDKVRRRGWHAEWRLTSVAWLCRACHSFVHGIASNEELAREWYTVELLMEREDVRRWVKWAATVRWKAR